MDTLGGKNRSSMPAAKHGGLGWDGNLERDDNGMERHLHQTEYHMGMYHQ